MELVNKTSIRPDNKISINQDDKTKFNKIFTARKHSMAKIITLGPSKFINNQVIKSSKTMQSNMRITMIIGLKRVNKHLSAIFKCPNRNVNLFCYK